MPVLWIIYCLLTHSLCVTTVFYRRIAIITKNRFFVQICVLKGQSIHFVGLDLAESI